MRPSRAAPQGSSAPRARGTDRSAATATAGRPESRLAASDVAKTVTPPSPAPRENTSSAKGARRNPAGEVGLRRRRPSRASREKLQQSRCRPCRHNRLWHPRRRWRCARAARRTAPTTTALAVAPMAPPPMDPRARSPPVTLRRRHRPRSFTATVVRCASTTATGPISLTSDGDGDEALQGRRVAFEQTHRKGRRARRTSSRISASIHLCCPSACAKA
jgi:hypothetical protein